MAAEAVSSHFGFPYPKKEDERVTAFLKHIRKCLFMRKQFIV
jgi:hypothetical protein